MVVPTIEESDDLAAVIGKVEAAITELRRRQGAAPAQAEEAKVDLAEIVNIERQLDIVPLPRTVYQLAQVLSLPPAMLTSATRTR